MLKIESLNVFYGDLQVLWDVSFHVDDKEIVALLGSNGAGKSTTIRAISGLLRPNPGTIWYKGHPLQGLPSHKIIDYGIVHVPEGRRIFPEMTVEENLIVGSLTPKARARRRETMEHVYELFPRLKERSKQPGGTLSGGEQQMLALGRGLMALPRVLMLDEPSLGLAPLLAEEIFQLMGVFNEEGMSILLVEQKVKQTLGLCHRAYVMENGQITLEGTGQELLNNSKVKEAYLGM